jgi:ATP-dependent DNA helicase RecQ
MFLSCAKRTGERFGAAHLIDVLRGSHAEKILRYGHDRLTTHGIGRSRSKEEWQHLARELARSGYIRLSPDQFVVVSLTERGSLVLQKRETIMLAASPAALVNAAASATTVDGAVEHPDLFDRLRALRKRLADQRGVPPYIIFADAALRQMAAELPTTPVQFRKISGVGEQKARDLAGVFTAAIAEYVRETGAQPGASSVARPPRPTRRATGGLGETIRTTLELFNSGKDLAAIAESRQLSLRTIEGHLVEALESGEALDLARLIEPAKQRAIEQAIVVCGAALLKPILEQLGEGYTYGEIGLVRAARFGPFPYTAPPRTAEKPSP